MHNPSGKRRFIRILLLLSLSGFAFWCPSLYARGPHYGGGHHTYSHGGHYAGATSGSSHKGGHYKNVRAGNHYGTHR
jgi:hypothetical protein